MTASSLVEPIKSYLFDKEWRTAEPLSIPERPQRLLSLDSLDLHPLTKKFPSVRFPNGLYSHQHKAIELLIQGANLCMLTGTASGKSLVFYVASIESLARNPKARLLALYPLKALGLEQEERWREALSSSGLNPDRVGRIDGDVPMATRQQIIKNASIVIATPDVVHAWLLSSLSDSNVLAFLRELREIVVDEVHSYAGVFGSNCAYLFRRLRYCLASLGIAPRFITASATVAAPDSFLEKLFGIEFAIIPSDMDTSPRQELTILMATPPRRSDLLTEVAGLLEFLAKSTKARFLAFVDSRKLSEHLATIVSRSEDPEDDGFHQAQSSPFAHLNQYSVLPYRAGYERYDRETIQRRLIDGTLRGVVSTSALELGIDVPHLDSGVLIGVPRSATSLMQRIGRVGRRVPGCVLVVNTGSLHDEAVFRKPAELLKQPLAQAALYLENRRIQYIHSLCLARHGGEHDQILEATGSNGSADLLGHLDWPSGFVELCNQERLGEIEPGLQSMKSEAGDNPNHTFPLRDAESQFQVELKSGPESKSLGSLSYSQVMREAYPGAVYYYTTIPFRVARIDAVAKIVNVFHTRRYFTSPMALPAQVFPNLSPGNVFTALEFDHALKAIECNMQIREALSGFVERRGQTKTTHTYPISAMDPQMSGITFRYPRFSRNFFTTGLILAYPNRPTDPTVLLRVAELIYETFLSLIPFERQDINFSIDRHRAERLPYAREGDRFIAIYDHTYGSLRLTSRLAELDVLRNVLRTARQVAVLPEVQADSGVIELLEALLISADQEPHELAASGEILPLADRYARVIMPGSRGLVLTKANEEANIVRVFIHPKFGLCYKVEYEVHIPLEELDVIVPTANVGEIPGESTIGWYDYQTGELSERLP